MSDVSKQYAEKLLSFVSGMIPDAQIHLFKEGDANDEYHYVLLVAINIIEVIRIDVYDNRMDVTYFITDFDLEYGSVHRKVLLRRGFQNDDEAVVRMLIKERNNLGYSVSTKINQQ